MRQRKSPGNTATTNTAPRITVSPDGPRVRFSNLEMNSKEMEELSGSQGHPNVEEASPKRDKVLGSQGKVKDLQGVWLLYFCSLWEKPDPVHTLPYTKPCS